MSLGRLFSIALSAMLAVSAAQAAETAPAFKDCPFSSPMPNYPAGQQPEWKNWDSETFHITQGNDSKDVSPRGPVCIQTYTETRGKTEGTALENMLNFKESWQQMGAEIARSADNDMVAHLTKDGKEYWLEASASRDDYYRIKVVEGQPLKRTLLPPSGIDFHLLGHMPGFVPSIENKKNYEDYAFLLADGRVSIRGALTIERNTAPAKMEREITPMEIVANYGAALDDLHAEILRDTPSDVTARFDDQGKTVWLYADQYRVVTLEERPFKMSLLPPTPDEIKDKLDKEGHIALYVNFDFAKATLKQDAQPIIGQVVELLKRNPDLKLTIDGNTDSVGGHDYNMKLSQDRAASVVAAIVAAGIDGARLSSGGYGPDKPIAPNDTDEGRAKNRRVELVKAPAG